MQIKYQEKIINNIDNLLSRHTLPQSILLVGDKGSGRHSIASYIKEKLCLEIIDISENISDETISDIYLAVRQNIYLLDFSVISIRNQNSLLKFIEEPPQNCIIICICEDKTQVINTIQNRCQIWVLQKYSKEQLKDFTEDEYLLSVCNTPGKILAFNSLTNVDTEYYKTLANTIIDRIYNANVANILTISDKLSFKNEEDNNLSIDVFIHMLKHQVLDRIYSGNDFSTQYELIQRLYNDLLIPHINKKYLFENFLLKLKYSKR